MISDVFIISILWLIPFFILKIDLSKKELIHEFFPILFKNNWFIGCYILLYLIHPLLNSLIESLTKKQLFRINFVIITLYFILQFIVKGAFFFNEILFFIFLYFITSYLKKYMNHFNKNIKVNVILLIVSVIGYFLITIITNYAGLHNEFFHGKVQYWVYNMANPFVLLISITLFNIFNSKTFYSNIINNISALSLLYYVIHENILFRTKLRPYIFNYFFFYIKSNILTIYLLTILLFIIGMVIAFIYKLSLQKLVHLVMDKIYELFKKIYLKFENKVLKT